MTVVKRVVLRCSPQRAFVLFTEQAGKWWPAERRHTADASSEIRLDAQGRFYERARDGTEVDLGVVRVFEPARRLMLDWYPGTGRENPTQVEVTFKEIAAGTEITVVHGPGAGGLDAFERTAAAYRQSWDLLLASLASAPAIGV